MELITYWTFRAIRSLSFGPPLPVPGSDSPVSTRFRNASFLWTFLDGLVSFLLDPVRICHFCYSRSRGPRMNIEEWGQISESFDLSFFCSTASIDRFLPAFTAAAVRVVHLWCFRFCSGWLRWVDVRWHISFHWAKKGFSTSSRSPLLSGDWLSPVCSAFRRLMVVIQWLQPSGYIELFPGWNSSLYLEDSRFLLYSTSASIFRLVFEMGLIFFDLQPG